MVDSSEGSSGAAHGARQDRGEGHGDDGSEGPSRGFFSRIMGVLTPSDGEGAVNGTAPHAPPPVVRVPGLLNLRRMRVEDVAVPKADIVAAPASISKDDLVAVFRESGLTRLPVFDGTLDTPIGLVNLKDFALRHGFNISGDGTPATGLHEGLARTLDYIEAEGTTA